MRRVPVRFWAAALVALAAIATLTAVGNAGSGRPAAGAARSSPAGTPTATRDQQSSTAASPSATDWRSLLARVAERTPHDPEALGRVDAPVVLVEFADYQCPFCGKFARDTQPALIRQYVQTGKLRIEWRDFPYLGPQSTTAAVAARAAGEQGKFWAYHDALYRSQHAVNSGYLTGSFLRGIAVRLGLDMARFDAAMKRPSLKAVVKAQMDEGLALGVTGTPAFIVGDQPLMGAQPLSTYQKLIDEQLAGR
jgi:protein-disulfide isomerase